MDTKKQFKTYAFLISVLSVLFVLYYLVFMQRLSYYIYNPDFLQVALFSESLFSDIIAFENWYITPSPYVFPDILCFGSLNLLIGDIRNTYTFFLYLNFMGFNLALFRLYRQFFEPKVFTFVAYSLALFGLFCLSSLDGFVFLNQFVPVNHLSAFICFAFLVKKDISFNKWFAPWIITIILIAFSDPVFVLYFVPVQGLFSIRQRKSIVRWVSPIIASIIGILLFKFSYSFGFLQAMNAKSSISFSISDGFVNLYHAITFLSGSITFIVLLILLVLAVIFILRKNNHNVILLYIILGVPLMGCLAGFIGSFDTIRYFTGSLFFAGLLGFSLFTGWLDRFLNKERIIYAFTGVVAMIVLYSYAFFADIFKTETPAHIAWIEQEAKKENAEYVMADYLNAKPILFFTDDINVLQVDGNLQPYLHEFDKRYYEQFEQNDSINALVFSANIDRNAIRAYEDEEREAFGFNGDSLFVLKKNPLK